MARIVENLNWRSNKRLLGFRHWIPLLFLGDWFHDNLKTFRWGGNPIFKKTMVMLLIVLVTGWRAPDNRWINNDLILYRPGVQRPMPQRTGTTVLRIRQANARRVPFLFASVWRVFLGKEEGERSIVYNDAEVDPHIRSKSLQVEALARLLEAKN